MNINKTHLFTFTILLHIFFTHIKRRNRKGKASTQKEDSVCEKTTLTQKKMRMLSDPKRKPYSNTTPY